MPVNKEQYRKIIDELKADKVILVAVSKTKPAADIQELYDLGQRHFGENYVQELVEKQAELPGDIYWHFIGHLQSNKIKYIAPFVHLIHGVDSLKLLKEINKQAQKVHRTIEVLLQVHIAQEETKFGLDESELNELLHADLTGLKNIAVKGLMGMASFTGNELQIRKEFRCLKSLFDKYTGITAPNISFTVLSMGMSSDYTIAIEEGSNMVRIGSLLFGSRS